MPSYLLNSQMASHCPGNNLQIQPSLQGLPQFSLCPPLQYQLIPLSPMSFWLQTHRPSFHLSNSRVLSHRRALALCPFSLPLDLLLVASLHHLGLSLNCHLFRQAFLTTQVESVLPTSLSVTLWPIVLRYCLQSLYHHLKLLVVYVFTIFPPYYPMISRL